MDAVKSFNAELSSLYEVKPPISKAKMTALTRGAIKAIKFYKHVVQSVEKFILKCKPEYKVPGLYVIDSIVRQSRHQFGSDKDVFAPRFAKNMQQTFANLFRCPPEDKSKVIRVLNLWQKNQVFPPEVIQPLFDFVDPNHPIHKEAIAAQQAANSSANGVNNQSGMLSSLNKGSPSGKTPTKTPIHQDISTPHLQGTPNSTNIGGVDVNMLQQLQKLQRLFLHQGGTPQDSNSAQLTPSGQPVRFDKKLLDFDYGSEDEDDKNPSPAVNTGSQQTSNLNSGLESLKNILANPEVLRQLQTLQQLQTGNSGGVQTQPLTAQALAQQQLNTQMDLEEKVRKLREMKQQEDEFDRHLAQTVPNLPFASECDLNPTAPATNSSSSKMGQYPGYPLPFDMTQPPPGYGHNNNNIPSSKSSKSKKSKQSTNQLYSPILDTQSENDLFDERTNVNGEVINLDQTDSQSPQSPQDLEERYERSHRKVRSRSRDRSKRSRSREKRSSRRGSRSRSRSRSRKRNRRSRSREREKERDREKDRERERERKKRGLPPLKTDNLSVCSTTLWVGHLSKLVHADELSDTFGEFGDIVSIDLIPPRGCAFIVMNRRQDAARCLSKLRNHKMQGKAITLAWAPGKGVKGKEWKDYWEVDLGVSYIPWNKLNENTDLESLEEGGMIDEESMPKWMKTRLEEQRLLQAAKSQPPPVQLPDTQVPPTDITQRAPPGYHPLATEGMPLQAQPGLPNTANMPPTRVDTSQPPPQAMIPPMSLPLVPPFQMMRGTGMPLQLPPGILGPNVPIGVPPPNMQQSLLQNQMLGYGPQRVMPAPHMNQMPPIGVNSAIPPPNAPPPDKDSLLGSGPPPGFVGQRIPTIITSQPPPNLSKLGFTPNQPPPQHQHDDMDIDMDDMDSSHVQHNRGDKSNNITLSDQLLAAIEGSSKSGRGTSQPKDNMDERSRSREFENRRGRGDSAGSRHSSSRDRERRDSRDNRNMLRDNRDIRRRDNSRDRRDNRDRNDRDRRGDGRDRRDRDRWPDRDMHERSRDRDSDRGDNKRQKSEKSLTERLQEMANENFSGRRPDENRMPPGGLMNITEEKSDFPYQRSPKDHEDRDPRNHEFGPRGGPMMPPNMRGGPPFMPPQDEMGGDRFDRFGPPGGFDRRDGPPPGFDRRGNDGFDNRMRGPQGMPPDFYGPPGFNRGPPMQMMRPDGAPMRGFGPRGPMMGNQRGGPPMFQRGGPRGPRGPPGVWMDGPPHGPGQNFGPNRGFDGPMDGPPPQYFQGPPGNMRPPFDDENGPPPHMQGFGPNRGRQSGPPMGGPMGDGRRYQRSHDSDEMMDERDYRNNRDRNDKRSRWGQNSEDGYSRHERSDNSGDETRSDRSKGEHSEKVEERGGNTTPLHDEPFVNENADDSYTGRNEDSLPQDEHQTSISPEFDSFEKAEESKPEISETKSEYEPKEEYNEVSQEEFKDEPSQEEYNEPSEEDFKEQPREEFNEPSQGDYNEPEDYNEPSQEEYNERSQEEYNEPKEEYNEPTKEEYNEPSQDDYYDDNKEAGNSNEDYAEPEQKYEEESAVVQNEPEDEQCSLPEVSAVEDNEVPDDNEVEEDG